MPFLTQEYPYYGPLGRLIRKVYIGPRIIGTRNDGLACHALAAIVVTVGAVVNLFIMSEVTVSTDQVGPVAQVRVAHQKIGSIGLVLHADMAPVAHLLTEHALAEDFFIVFPQVAPRRLQLSHKAVVSMAVLATHIGLIVDVVQMVATQVRNDV